MPTDNSERPNTGSLPEPETKSISMDLVKKIFAVAILAEVIVVWVFVFRIISRAKIGMESPRFVLVAIGVGLSLIGWGFAKSLYPRIPGISWTKALRYVFGFLAAAYALYPTYENFRGEDEITLATLGLFQGRTIEDVHKIAPKLKVLQHTQNTYRVEVSQRDARQLMRKRFRLQPIQDAAQRRRVERITSTPAGQPNIMIKNMIRSVSSDSLLGNIRQLEKFGTRVEYSPQEDSAAELIIRKFKGYGLDVESLRFGEVSRTFWHVQVVNDRTLFCSDYQGELFSSTDGGGSWKCRYTGREPFLRLAFFDDRIGFAISAMNRILRTTDGGQSWIVQRPDTVTWFSDIRCLSPQEAIVVGNNGIILRTENGGNRWQRVRTPSVANLHGIEALNSKNLWVIGSGGVLLHSSDGGKTWSQVLLGISCNLFHIQFLDRERGMLLSDNAILLRTNDGGRTWKWSRIERNELRPSGMLFATAQKGWITDAGISSHPIETSDGGRHWAEARKELQPIRKLSSGNGNVALGSGVNGELLISHDRGNTWKSLSSKLSTFAPLRSRNLCATLKGSNPYAGEVILVGHYDSAHSDVPGANDNASGTAAVLEVARICSRYKFERTIRFLAAAAEERGLVGSGIYAQDARRNGRNIVTVVNADMIGYPVLGDPNRIAVSTGKEWTPLMDSTLLFNGRYALGFILDAHTAAMGGSDHESFIRQGYSAIDLSEGTAMEIWGGFDPFYHKSSDTSDKLDANLVRNATQLMLTIAAEAARPSAPSAK
ncbi:MAG: M28 family peptidase [Ignavibacteriales bacterium]|nr:M28 family peptidase [Ignavibacteriales bacterium]